MQMHAVPVRVELAELASDKETVAVSPGHAGTGVARAPVAPPWAALADRWQRHWEAKRTDSSSASVTTSAYSYRSSSSSDVSGPAPGNTATPALPPFGALAMPPTAPPVVPLAPPVALPAPPAAPPLLPADRLPAALTCSSISSISLQQLSGFGADASELHFLFARLFTPKHPSTLPRSQWLSYTRLFATVQPYAPARVWKQGRGNLKQLVIEWCQHHPAYAGLAQSAWCMRLKDDDQQALPGRKQAMVYKFCLECTP
eukprot:scaffold133311_cov88-Phaeocystis_antarctica.AAC.1